MSAIKKVTILVHTLGYYVVWFVSILTAHTSPLWLGPGIAMTVSALQLIWQKQIVQQTSGLMRMIGLFVLCGFVFDSLLISIGMISFSNSVHPLLTPPFMVAIWFNFALFFYAVCMPLAKKYVWLAALSGVGFPVAYSGGAYLGAATITEGWLSLFVIGGVYALAIPATLFIYNKGINTHAHA